MIAQTIGGVIRPRVAVARDVESDSRLAEAVALRRCALYRKAFRGTAVTYPAEVLRLDAVANWIREQGVGIEVASIEDLDRVRLAGIDAARVVKHCHGEVSLAACRAAFGRFVVESGEQIAKLADNPLERPQRVLVDEKSADELAAEVLTHQQLHLVGLHSRRGDVDEHELTQTVVGMIAKMACVGRRHAVLLTRLSLGNLDVSECDGDLRSLRRLAKVIEQAIEDGCIRYRYPRPAVTVSLPRSVLLPT
jgi:pyridoxal-dependent decarboxylase-like protein